MSRSASGTYLDHLTINAAQSSLSIVTGEECVDRVAILDRIPDFIGDLVEQVIHLFTTEMAIQQTPTQVTRRQVGVRLPRVWAVVNARLDTQRLLHQIGSRRLRRGDCIDKNRLPEQFQRIGGQRRGLALCIRRGTA